MSVRIFTKNQQFRHSLENALHIADITVNEGDSPDLGVVFDADDKIKALAKEINCPLFKIEEDEALAYPFRLGLIVDKIKHHIKMIQLRGKKVEINIGDSVLNFRDSTLKKPDQEAIILTEKEVMILTFLHQSHPAPVTREALLNGVWGYADTVETHTLETHIYRLRRKIEDDPSNPQILITKEEGYGLNF